MERQVMDDLRPRRKLEARGIGGLADELNGPALERVADDVVFVIPAEPIGLGRAVLCARNHVLDGPVAVVLAEDPTFGAPYLEETVNAYRGGHLVATMTFEKHNVSKYGVRDAIGQTDVVASAKGMVKNLPKRTRRLARLLKRGIHPRS